MNGLLLILILGIGAEENSSNPATNLSPQEENALSQINSEVNLDMQPNLTKDLSNTSLDISLDIPNEFNESILSEEINKD